MSILSSIKSGLKSLLKINDTEETPKVETKDTESTSKEVTLKSGESVNKADYDDWSLEGFGNKVWDAVKSAGSMALSSLAGNEAGKEGGLNRLYYDGKQAGQAQKENYVQQLYNYKTISEKVQKDGVDSLTDEEKKDLKTAVEELPKYKEADGGLISDLVNSNTIAGRLLNMYAPAAGIVNYFWGDSIESAATSKADPNILKSINPNKIAKELDLFGGAGWGAYNSAVPGKDASQESKRTLTEKQIDDENYRYDHYTKWIDNKATKLADMGIKLPGGPNRNATASEVKKVLEGVLNGSRFGMNVDGYTEIAKQLHDLGQYKLEKDYLIAINDSLDLAAMLATMPEEYTDEQIIANFIEKKGRNPLDFTFRVEDLDASDEVKDIINGLIAAGSFGGDRYNVGNIIVKALQAYKDGGIDMLIPGLGQTTLDLGEQVKAAWSDIELAGAVTTDLLSRAGGAVNGLIKNWIDGTWTWEDYAKNQKLMQTSSIFNTREDLYGEDFSNKGALNYGYHKVASVIDDLVNAYVGGKKINFEVSVPTVKELKKAETLLKGTKDVSKLKGVIAATQKEVDDAIKGIGEGVKDTTKAVEKATTKQTKSVLDKAIERAKGGLKNKKDVTDVIKKDTGGIIKTPKTDGGLVLGNNVARWIAEEAVSSAYFQGMVPYEYEPTDLAIDLAGSLFSGILRITEFNNKWGYNSLNNQNALLTEWYLSEANGFSKQNAARILNSLSPQAVQELGGAIKKMLEGMIDENVFKWVNEKEFNTLAGQLSTEKQKQLRKMANQLSEMSNQNLLRLVYQSSDENINKYAKLSPKTDELTDTTKQRLEWNKPKNMSKSQWAKKLDELRTRLYKTGSIDGRGRITGRSKLVGQIKKYVDNNTFEVASQKRFKKQYSKYFDEKGNWVEGTSDTVKDKIKSELVAQLLKDRGINVNKGRLGKGLKQKLLGKEYTSLLDETVDWEPRRRFNIFINALIEAKEGKRIGLVNAIKLAPGEMKNAFKMFVDLRTNGKYGDLLDIPTEELEALAQEFGENWQKLEQTYLALNKGGDIENISKSDAFMANKTYPDALKENPDLKYMSQSEFDKIKDDPSMDIFQKELVLRSFRHDNISSRYGNVIVGVNTYDDAPLSGPSIANEVDRKMLFGKTGYVYIKRTEHTGTAALPAKNGTKENNLINAGISGEQGTMKYKYELVGSSDTGMTHYYDIENDRGRSIGQIAVGKRPDGNEYVKIIRNDSEGGIPKSKSYSIEIQRKDDLKPNQEPIVISPEDIDTVKPDDVIINGNDIFTNEDDYASYTLKTWNEVGQKVRKGTLTYQEFAELMPGYADRVPPEIFNVIMKDIHSPVNRMELLVATINNPKIISNDIGYTFDLSGDGVVFTIGHSNTYTRDPNDGGKLKFSRSTSESDMWGKIISNNNKGGLVSVVDEGNGGNPVLYYYQYDPKRRGYVLYNKPVGTKGSKPVGFVNFTGGKRMDVWLMGEDGYRRKVTGSATFYKPQASEAEIRGRLADTPTNNRKALPDDVTFEDVYKMLYDGDISAETLYHLRADPSMTPTKYFYQEIDKLINSPEFEGLKINGNYKSMATKFKRAKKTKEIRDAFDKKYPKNSLTPQQKFDLGQEIIRRLNKNGDIDLSKAEQEVADLIYGKGRKLDVYDKMNVLGYTKYGINPAESGEALIKKLHNRKDALLMLKGISPNVLNKLSDEAKEMLYKLHYSNSEKTLTEQLDDLIESGQYLDVFEKFPQQMSEILYNLYKDADFTEEEAKRLEQITKRIEKAEKKWAKKNKDPNKRLWKKFNEGDRKDIRVKVENSLIEAAQQKITKLKEELLKYQDAGDLENRKRVEDEIAELQESINISGLIKEQKKALSQGEMQEASLQRMAERRMVGIEERPYVEPMTEAEIEARISMINKSDVRVLKLDPATGELDLKGLTPEEQALYTDHLRDIGMKIAKGEINAAHFAPLHAIVIDPKILTEYDLGHEWYHEAVKSMMDQGRRNEVVSSVWKDYRKEIIENANNRGYTIENYYQQTGKTAEDLEGYKKWITEEWLADRFGEYINGKFVAEKGSVLERFFEDLWQYIRLIFSDEKALELFDDIYAGNVEYTAKISDEATDAYSLPTRKYTNDSGFPIGDNIATIATDLVRQGFGAHEITEILNPKNAGRGYYGTPQFNQTFDYLLKSKGQQFADTIDDYITKDKSGNILDRKEVGVVNTSIMEDIRGSLGKMEGSNISTKINDDGTVETTTQLGGVPIFLYQKFKPRNIENGMANQMSDYFVELNICGLPVYKTTDSLGEMGTKAHDIERIAEQLMIRISNKMYKSRGDYVMFNIGRNLKEFMVQGLPITKGEGIVLADSLWSDVENYKFGTQSNFKNIPGYKNMEDAYKIYFMNTMISHSEIENKKKIEWNKYQLRKFGYKPADMIGGGLSEMTQAMFNVKVNKTEELVNRVLNDPTSMIKVYRGNQEKNLIEFVYEGEDGLVWKLGWHLGGDPLNTLGKLTPTPTAYDKYPYVWGMSPFSLPKNKYKNIIEKGKERASFSLMKTLQDRAADYVSQGENVNKIATKVAGQGTIPVKDKDGYKVIGGNRIYTDYEKIDELKKQLNDDSIEVKGTIVPEEYSESRSFIPYSEVQSAADDGIIKYDKSAPLTSSYYAVLLRKRNDIYNKYGITEQALSKKRKAEISSMRQDQRKKWLEDYKSRTKEQGIDTYKYRELKAEQEKLLAKKAEYDRITEEIKQNPLYIISRHLDESLVKNKKVRKAVESLGASDDAKQLKDFITNEKYKIHETTSKYGPLTTRIDRSHIQSGVYQNKAMAEIIGQDGDNIINSPSKIISEDPKFRKEEMELTNQNRETFAVSDFEPKMFNEMMNYDNVIIYATDDVTLDAYNRVMKKNGYNMEYKRDGKGENIEYFKKEKTPEEKQIVEDDIETAGDMEESFYITTDGCPYGGDISVDSNLL